METEKSILELAREQFKTWNDALQTKNPAEVAKLYRDDCLLLPTFPEDGKEAVGKEGVKDYFDHFLTKSPIGIIITEEVKEKAKNLIKYSGKYDFEVGLNGKREIIHAEYIFIWKKENEKWGIIFHYSAPLDK